MHSRFYKFFMFTMLSVPYSAAFADSAPATQTTTTEISAPQTADKLNLATLGTDKRWYFSFGLSKQQYAPSDIHVSQPSENSDFTVHQARGGDYSGTPGEVLNSLLHLGLTDPQENVRIGKFMNAEKTFAVEFSLDHTKYNTNLGQTSYVSGTVNGQPYNQNLVLDKTNFDYELHNGLNHLMINAVWFRHLAGPEQKPGDWELLSRVGAGILLPHAQNTIFGKENEVGPKGKNDCCNSTSWWQINGWTVGVEEGVRYRMSASFYAELTAKVAYGELKGVPVYHGTADQTLWMSEEVLSIGYLY
jgi:hypothetical protein